MTCIGRHCAAISTAFTFLSDSMGGSNAYMPVGVLISQNVGRVGTSAKTSRNDSGVSCVVFGDLFGLHRGK